MELRIRVDDAGTIHLTGPVDLNTVAEVAFALRQGRGPITLDVSGVTRFDDSAAGLIMRRLGHGPVTLVGATASVIERLAMARMLDLPGLTVDHPSSES
jgi:anti-anti-sigma regulatory factor